MIGKMCFRYRMAKKFLWGSAVEAGNAAAYLRNNFWAKFGQMGKFGQKMLKVVYSLSQSFLSNTHLSGENVRVKESN